MAAAAAAAAAEHDLDLEQLSRPSVLSSVGRAEIGRDLSCDPLSSRSLSLPLFPPLPGPVGRSVGRLYRQTFISGRGRRRRLIGHRSDFRFFQC